MSQSVHTYLKQHVPVTIHLAHTVTEDQPALLYEAEVECQAQPAYN